METVSRMTVSQSMLYLRRSILNSAASFLRHQFSTVFGQSVTGSKRGSMPLVGKLSFFILLFFATLCLRTVLLSNRLLFGLFCGARKSHGDRFMERLSDLVLLNEFRYVDW